MAQQFWIVQAGENPSTDFFIKPELNNAEACHFHCFERPPSTPPEAGVSLIFVRYLSRAWVRWVERHRHLINELIYFMDDDLFDTTTHRGLSMIYRWKLYYNARRYKSWLQSQNACLWLSTSWLVDKYQDWQPTLLSAKSPYIALDEVKTVFYHGSSSHIEEMRWLLPVIRTVLETDSSLVFEIIGDHKIRRMFSALPRVNVLHPMSWESYKALISRPGRTIGLAPLLDSRFNQARSFTKLYDITLAGAVGIYADHPVYQPVINHQKNGLLVPMHEQSWVDAILELSRQSDTREALLKEARKSL
ncbi:glycosyltransferase family 1 protein [Amphritea sp.]|uniref:glycosyltransferase family 1 protein n=1 Tax=Amphritea sp. TaxID=1872502 RepID=UPI0025BFBA56|nr:glycosyltransferase family 1 protein [Amphritea sp.]